MRGLLLMFVVCALFACADEAPTSSNDSGVAGMDGGGMDARVDSGMDARVDSGVPTTWIATKTTLDVWWPGAALHEPGRGSISVWTLAATTSECADEGSDAIARICGIELPTLRDLSICGAHDLRVPNAAWDDPQMPRLRHGTATDTDAGEVAAVLEATLGMEVAAAGAWPPQVDAESCETAAATDCYADHDGDGRRGISAIFRNDRALYVEEELCSRAGGLRYQGTKAVGEPTHPTRVARWDLVMRMRLAPWTIGGCTDAVPGAGSSFEMAVVGCDVEPTSLPYFDPPIEIANDPRAITKDYRCHDWEVELQQRVVPQFRALEVGAVPGEVRRPYSWTSMGQNRDIDRTPSEGPRVASVVLNVDDLDAGDDGAPSCAQVRAAFAND